MTWHDLLLITVSGWVFAAIAVIVLLCLWVARLDARLHADDQLLDDLDASDEDIAQVLAAWRDEVQRQDGAQQ